MKKIIKEAKIYDENAVNLGLDEIILMENAGLNLAKITQKALRKKGVKNGRILILLGGGNNAADGLVALRHLKNAYAFLVDKNLKKSTLFEKQLKIALNLKCKFLSKVPNFNSFDAIIECIFGSGQKRALSENLANLIEKINKSRAIKIACDMPVNLGFEPSFKADITATMGAIKELLLEDFAKEFTGRIKCVNLGLSDEIYSANLNAKNSKNLSENSAFLLEKKDLKMIKRKISSNKGDFGHGFVFGSSSAGSICGLAALNFGAGLISLYKEKPFSPLIMRKEKVEQSATAAALGMGLEDLKILDNEILEKIPLVLDANCFNSTKIAKFLMRENAVFTPHPKEFTRLYKIAFKENLSIENLQKSRFFYARKFTQKFHCVLVLKGANTIIAQNGQIFVVNLGCKALSKGGSGDALSGMILALLCAKFSPLEAAKNAVLAHAIIAKKYKFNANSFDAIKLIKGLKCL